MSKNKFGWEKYFPICESERMMNRNMDKDFLKHLIKDVEDYISNYKLTNGVNGFLNCIYDELVYLESQEAEQNRNVVSKKEFIDLEKELKTLKDTSNHMINNLRKDLDYYIEELEKNMRGLGDRVTELELEQE